MIHVYLRHCYYSKLQEQPSRGRPFWWDKEKVFQNFKNTLNPETTRYTIIYDEHYGKIRNTFLSREDGIHIINAGGEAKSFLKTLEFIKSQNHCPEDIIYFLEDDYVHQPNWDKILLEGFTLPADYVTLYDHNDKYTDMYLDLRTKVLHTPSVHWMATPSTTNTFAVRYSTLLEDFLIHEQYSMNTEPSLDHLKFLELSGKNRLLVSSIPGYSTHCHTHLLSPCIDWEQYV